MIPMPVWTRTVVEGPGGRSDASPEWPPRREGGHPLTVAPATRRASGCEPCDACEECEACELCDEWEANSAHPPDARREANNGRPPRFHPRCTAMSGVRATRCPGSAGERRSDGRSAFGASAATATPTGT